MPLTPAAGTLHVGDMVVFVDYRENRENKVETLDGALRCPSFIDSLAANDAVRVRKRLVVARLETADVIVARVVAADSAEARVAGRELDETATLLRQPTLPPPPSSSSSSAAAAAAPTAVRRPSQLLAEPATTVLAPLFAAERKTVGDLAASMDGDDDVPRENHVMKEIIELADFCATVGARPLFLFEGYARHALTGEPVRVMPQLRMNAFVIRLFSIDGVPPFQSATADGSATVVWTLVKQCTDYDIGPSSFERVNRGSYMPRISCRKERNADVGYYYRSILQAMPRMSPALAAAVADAFPTIPTLVRALDAAPATKSRLLLLSELTVNGRRLGPKLAVSVVARFYDAPTMEQAAQGGQATASPAATTTTASSSSSATRKTAKRTASTKRPPVKRKLDVTPSPPAAAAAHAPAAPKRARPGPKKHAFVPVRVELDGSTSDDGEDDDDGGVSLIGGIESDDDDDDDDDDMPVLDGV